MAESAQKRVMTDLQCLIESMILKCDLKFSTSEFQSQRHQYGIPNVVRAAREGFSVH